MAAVASTATDKGRVWLRVLLAGPLSLAAACLAVVGAVFWLPPGNAAINNLALPVVLFPLLWTGMFLYACLDTNLARAYAIMGAISAVNLLLLAMN